MTQTIFDASQNECVPFCRHVPTPTKLTRHNKFALILSFAGTPKTAMDKRKSKQSKRSSASLRWEQSSGARHSYRRRRLATVHGPWHEQSKMSLYLLRAILAQTPGEFCMQIDVVVRLWLISQMTFERCTSRYKAPMHLRVGCKPAMVTAHSRKSPWQALANYCTRGRTNSPVTWR
jgi:hypothetical protein